MAFSKDALNTTPSRIPCIPLNLAFAKWFNKYKQASQN